MIVLQANCDWEGEMTRDDFIQVGEDFGQFKGLFSLSKLRGFHTAAVFLSDENRFEYAAGAGRSEVECTHKFFSAETFLVYETLV